MWSGAGRNCRANADLLLCPQSPLAPLLRSGTMNYKWQMATSVWGCVGCGSTQSRSSVAAAVRTRLRQQAQPHGAPDAADKTLILGRPKKQNPVDLAIYGACSLFLAWR